jgi:hypothetical protein
LALGGAQLYGAHFAVGRKGLRQQQLRKAEALAPLDFDGGELIVELRWLNLGKYLLSEFLSFLLLFHFVLKILFLPSQLLINISFALMILFLSLL